MRIGIYDRWLATLGGGERLVAAIAETFPSNNDVEILTHCDFDRDTLARRFGSNLDRVRIEVVADSADFSAVRAATARYDLFFNASHLDYFPPLAKRSLLVVFFPTSTLRHAAALGAYNRAKSAARQIVTTTLGAAAPSRIRALVSAGGTRSSDQTTAGRAILGAFQMLSSSHRDNGVLQAYDGILAISEFTRRWIRQFWNLDSQVLYPPVDTSSLRPLTKRHQILCVGRFFAGSHNKKQDALVRSFRQLRAGQLADWELHLAGGFSPTESNRAFLDRVIRAIGGDPSIHLHLNCESNTLRQLYGESMLFWHATGFGENEDDHPERFEHFGITTVEAMAAGCVPVVYSGGGQPEIIQSGKNGILWTTTDDMIRITHELAFDEPRRSALATSAMERAREFDGGRFRDRLRRLVDSLDQTGAVG